MSDLELEGFDVKLKVNRLVLFFLVISFFFPPPFTSSSFKMSFSPQAIPVFEIKLKYEIPDVACEEMKMAAEGALFIIRNRGFPDSNPLDLVYCHIQFGEHHADFDLRGAQPDPTGSLVVIRTMDPYKDSNLVFMRYLKLPEDPRGAADVSELSFKFASDELALHFQGINQVARQSADDIDRALAAFNDFISSVTPNQ